MEYPSTNLSISIPLTTCCLIICMLVKHCRNIPYYFTSHSMNICRQMFLQRRSPKYALGACCKLIFLFIPAKHIFTLILWFRFEEYGCHEIQWKKIPGLGTPFSTIISNKQGWIFCVIFLWWVIFSELRYTNSSNLNRYYDLQPMYESNK